MREIHSAKALAGFRENLGAGQRELRASAFTTNRQPAYLFFLAYVGECRNAFFVGFRPTWASMLNAPGVSPGPGRVIACRRRNGSFLQKVYNGSIAIGLWKTGADMRKW